MILSGLIGVDDGKTSDGIVEGERIEPVRPLPSSEVASLHALARGTPRQASLLDWRPLKVVSQSRHGVGHGKPQRPNGA